MLEYVRKLRTVFADHLSQFIYKRRDNTDHKTLAIYYAAAIGDYFYSNKERTKISSTLPFMNYILYNVDVSEKNPRNRDAFIRGKEDHNKIATILRTGERELKLEEG